MYVDESGDGGLIGSPTTHFVLSGLVVHESRWRECITKLIEFRKTMKLVHALPVRTEIHASDYMRRAPVAGMPRHVRLAILRNLLDELAKLDCLSITNVVVDKTTKPPTYDVFENAWRALFQRFENTLQYGNFPGAHRADFGLVLTDATDGRKLTRLVRRMAVYNPIPNVGGAGSRNIPMLRVIEDPHPKDSKDSYFVQAADVVAYFVMQHVRPSAYSRRVGAQNYAARLLPVLNRHARKTDPLGIVRL